MTSNFYSLSFRNTTNQKHSANIPNNSRFAITFTLRLLEGKIISSLRLDKCHDLPPRESEKRHQFRFRSADAPQRSDDRSPRERSREHCSNACKN